MRDIDGEEEEWQRLERERAKLPPRDRLYRNPLRTTESGDRDRRHARRKGRVTQTTLRMQLKVRAVMALVLDRDHHDGLPGLFEVMMDLYLEKYGPIHDSEIPPDDELARRYLKKQDEKDGK
jgi:hypothetical protein